MPENPWIWQSPSSPKLTFDLARLLQPLNNARKMAGRLHGKAQALGADELVRVERDVWAGSALATAAIEGEKLNLEGVRSSVTARLGLSVPDDTAPKSIEALFEVMSDAAHWPEALTAEQLVAW